MKRTIVILMLIIVSFIWLLGSLAIGAQERYPTRPITCIVPYGIGGMTDVSSRLVSKKMEQKLGQKIIIVNKPGGVGIVGTLDFLRQKPDGYTVCATTADTPIGPLINQTGKAIEMRKFKYIGGYMNQQRVIFTHIDAPYKTFKELVAYIKEHPGEVSVGSGDLWAIDILKAVAVKEGLKMQYVLFNSGAEVSAAMFGHHITFCENGVGTPTYQAARAGERVRIVLNLCLGTIPGFPEVPNIKEVGYPFSERMVFGYVFQADVPEYIREKWENTLKEVMQDPELIDKMKGLGFEPQFFPAKEWEEFFREVEISVPDLLEYIKGLKE